MEDLCAHGIQQRFCAGCCQACGQALPDNEAATGITPCDQQPCTSPETRNLLDCRLPDRSPDCYSWSDGHCRYHANHEAERADQELEELGWGS